ncbi:MAG: glucose-6-phosphate isomerase [Phycisphaerae bacterium]
MADQIKLYYKNVTADIVGQEHGLSLDQFKYYTDQIAQTVNSINQQVADGKLPFRRLPYDQQMVQRTKDVAGEMRGRYDNLVVLGIGGSALGNIALQTALNHPFYNLLPSDRRAGPKTFVMDNVDPVQFQGLLDLLDGQLDRTLFNVVSKSGETAETASQFLIVRNLIRTRRGASKLAENIIVTTDPASGTLRQIAARDGYITLAVPPGVGGRFSVLSQVGLFSAAMCGIDIEGLMAGARDMDQRVSKTELVENPAAIFALIQYLFYGQGKTLSVMMPYSYQLKDLSDWFRQLWAESLGKDKTLDGKPAQIGPTPIKALGTTDQHSQVQLYREGLNNKVFTFLEVEKFASQCPIPRELEQVESIAYLGGKSLEKLINNEKIATEYALVASKRPCLTIVFPEISAYCVGQFIYMLETATSIAGSLFNLNTYDQPAVELGKQATFALMERAGYEELAKKMAASIQRDKKFLV